MTKTDNRTNGGRFEQEFSHLLANDGFWVHVCQQNKDGQPADIIAAKGKFHTLIDCKVISDEKKGFTFDRVEDNQRYAMRMFTRRCNELCYFALKLPDDRVRLVSLNRIETLESRGNKGITMRMMDTETWGLEAWLEATDDWGADI